MITVGSILCFRLFYATFAKTYGSLTGEAMLHDLEAAIDEYNKETGARESARVEVVDNQLIVVICTPLMKRILSHVSGL